MILTDLDYICSNKGSTDAEMSTDADVGVDISHPKFFDI